MRINNKSKAAISFLKVRFFKQRIPLAVRWQLTNRCISRCYYCRIWDVPQEELSTKNICSILDELVDLGTQTISFSGGEPMLRRDIGDILDYAKKKNISTEMNSTGFGIPENIKKLKNLDFLKLSLDGPEQINDSIRCEGGYKIAIQAAESARKNNLNFIFTCTLTKFNIKQEAIEHLLDIAEYFNTQVAFQPLKELYRGVSDMSHLNPDREEFRKALDLLIITKRKTGSVLRNSLIGLYHIYHWPEYKKLNCWAGKIFCMIDTSGTLFPCDRIFYKDKLPNCLESGFKKAFSSLPIVSCAGCGFCGVLELNFLMAFRIATLQSILKVLK